VYFFICYWIWWRLEFCLVFVLRICEFTLYWSLLLTTDQRSESMYCNWRCITFSFLSGSLHELVHVQLIIIFFCVLKIFTLYEELAPPKYESVIHDGRNMFHVIYMAWWIKLHSRLHFGYYLLNMDFLWRCTVHNYSNKFCISSVNG